MRIVMFGICLLLGVVLAGCGGVSPGLVERQMVTRAPELIGPADSYRAEVRGASAQGVEYARLIGVAVRPDPHLVVDPLTLTLEGVRYQASPFRITSIARTTFAGRVSENAINEYVSQPGRFGNNNVRNIRVRLEQGEVTVAANVNALGMDVPIATTGRLRTDGGIRVSYDPRTLTILGLEVPATVRTLLTNQANPLVNLPMVNLSGLRFTPHIERLILEPGALRIEGRAELRNMP